MGRGGCQVEGRGGSSRHMEIAGTQVGVVMKTGTRCIDAKESWEIKLEWNGFHIMVRVVFILSTSSF